jgi:hypothetical protein
MKWILILILLNGGKVSTSTQEFNTQAACEAVLERLNTDNWRPYSFCTPKGMN